MKKFIKLTTVLIVISIILSVFLCVPTFAASSSVSVSSKSVIIGNNVTVTVTINGGEAMYATEANVSYNAGVLQFLSGTSANGGNGSIKIVGTPGGASSQSYTLNFKTIGEGQSSISLGAVKYVGNDEVGVNGASTAVTVSKPAPSSNCNLSSLSIPGITLSPAFSPNNTVYSASVPNDVQSITIKAMPASADAVVNGMGEKSLNEGDNSFGITVIALSGAKKIYTVNIRRRLAGEKTVEELLTVNVGSATKKIVKDISALPLLPGFTASTATYNDQEVGVMVDKNNKYTIYYLSDPNGENASYFILNSNNEFEPLPYIKSGEKVYIIATAPQSLEIPKGFCSKELPFNNSKYPAFAYNDKKMNGFYILYCYDGEDYGFYSYDSELETLQRFPLFSLEKSKPVVAKKTSWLDKIKLSPTLTLVLLCTVFILLLAVVVLSVLLSKKGKNRNNGLYDLDDSEFSEEDITDGFVINTDSFEE